MADLKRKPRSEGYERVPEIVAAAMKVFGEHGYDRTTMRRIAAEANLSPAGLYIYFDSKEAILAIIRDKTFEGLYRYARLAIAGETDPRLRLRRHLRAYLDYAISHPDAYRLTFQSHMIRAPRPGRPSNPVEAAGREAFNTLLDDIAALMAPATTLEPATVHVVAEAAWAAIHGFVSLVIDVSDFPASGLEPAFDELVNMVLSGINTRTAE